MHVTLGSSLTRKWNTTHITMWNLHPSSAVDAPVKYHLSTSAHPRISWDMLAIIPQLLPYSAKHSTNIYNFSERPSQSALVSDITLGRIEELVFILAIEQHIMAMGLAASEILHAPFFLWSSAFPIPCRGCRHVDFGSLRQLGHDCHQPRGFSNRATLRHEIGICVQHVGGGEWGNHEEDLV